MEQLTIDLVYGTALFQAAKESDKIQLIYKEIKEIDRIFSSEVELFKIVSDPSISANERKAVVEKLFHGKISEEAINFLCVLIDKGRIVHYANIVKAYKKLLDEASKVSNGQVYSVRKLDKEQLEQLEKETSKILKEKVCLENLIDKSLIGGFKVLVNGKIIDASVKERLKSLSKALK